MNSYQKKYQERLERAMATLTITEDVFGKFAKVPSTSGKFEVYAVSISETTGHSESCTCIGSKDYGKDCIHRLATDLVLRQRKDEERAAIRAAEEQVIETTVLADIDAFLAEEEQQLTPAAPEYRIVEDCCKVSRPQVRTNGEWQPCLENGEQVAFACRFDAQDYVARQMEQERYPAPRVSVGEAITSAVEAVTAVIEEDAVAGDRSYAQAVADKYGSFYEERGQQISEAQRQRDLERSRYLNWELGMGL